MTAKDPLLDAAGCGTGTERDRKNQRRYQQGMLLWAAVYVASTLVIHRWVPQGPGSVALALLPSLVALVPARQFLRFLREADELQRQLQLEAMAAALVAAFIIFPAVRLLDRAGLSLGGWRNDIVPLVVIATYMASTIAGIRRYR